MEWKEQRWWGWGVGGSEKRLVQAGQEEWDICLRWGSGCQGGKETQWQGPWWVGRECAGVRQGAQEPAGRSPSPEVAVSVEGRDPRRRQGFGRRTEGPVSLLGEHLGASCESHGRPPSGAGEGGPAFHKAFQMFALLVCFIYLFS